MENGDFIGELIWYSIKFWYGFYR